jgi:hypothetical protein
MSRKSHNAVQFVTQVLIVLSAFLGAPRLVATHSLPSALVPAQVARLKLQSGQTGALSAQTPPNPVQPSRVTVLLNPALRNRFSPLKRQPLLDLRPSKMLFYSRTERSRPTRTASGSLCCLPRCVAGSTVL